MISCAVVFDGRETRVVYDNTYQGLHGSCVKFSQTVVVVLKTHFETKKQSQKWEYWFSVHFSVRWSWIILLSADCCLPQYQKV